MAQGKEGKIQIDCIHELKKLSCVMWCMSTSVGKYRIAGRSNWLTIGFKGLGDIIGMFDDGKFFAIEVKQPGEKPTKEQYSFIKLVNECGGVAFWTDTASDVDERLIQLRELQQEITP